MSSIDILADKVFEETDPFLHYTEDFEKAASTLREIKYRSAKPEDIAMPMLAAVARFYDGDWAGILDADLVMKVWSPLWWYNRRTKGMTPNSFDDIQEGDYLFRWVDALKNGTPLLIESIDTIKETSPLEYQLLRRNGVHSILAVPFWNRSTGFLIVRNPKRYLKRSEFLQMMVYVAIAAVYEKALVDRTSISVKSEYVHKESDVLVCLFGGLQIVTCKGVVTEENLSSPKIVRLIAFLALHGKSFVSVRDIVSVVWNEGDPDIDGKNIKYLIYRFQRVFSLISPYRLIESSNYGYRLNPELNLVTDLTIFEDCWYQSHLAPDMRTRGMLLKKAMDLYRNGVMPELAGEPWIMPSIAHYALRYIGVVNQLLLTLDETEDYVCIYEYANRAVQAIPGNVDVHYWLIYAMHRLGNIDIARNQLRAARQILTQEDYADLQTKLGEKGISF